METQRNLESFRVFQKRIESEMMVHRIITQNEYTQWFAKGEMSLEHLKAFTVQFSVFSNLFLIAQLKKMINAVDLNEMHKAKEILANEIGCVFKSTKVDLNESSKSVNKEKDGDPKLVNTEGTVDGGTFRFKAAHFEWLLKFAKPLGLEFKHLGKRSHGSKSTLHFCDELDRLYGNEDFNIAAGASFAVENWAAAGFWKELYQGLEHFREDQSLKLPLGFFTWHDKVEDQHKEDTIEELEDLYFGEHDFNEDVFMESGLEMLDGVAHFWDGLNEQRVEESN